jgi:hydroxymethylpyrimidine pyrophosphatase-like HAD family hydrolase
VRRQLRPSLVPQMNFFAIATDYDGTLAYDGRVRESTIRALKAVRESGRTLVLVSADSSRSCWTSFPSTICLIA